MASNSKRSKPSTSYNVDEVLAMLDKDESDGDVDSEAGGMYSGEESEIDRQLLDLDEKSSDEEQEISASGEEDDAYDY